MRADVFCRVIDNFGDIGVTWRVVRQLSLEFGWAIRLWVDDLHVFSRIEPRLDPTRTVQSIAGVTIMGWPEPGKDASPVALAEPAPLVIAAFSCEPPKDFVQRMQSSASTLVNLEYLSAEPWVEGCHALPAMRADGIDAHYFFPGFNTRTGGLPREADLAAQRSAWLCDRVGQRALLAGAGVSDEGMRLWDAHDGARLITLFAYPHAPVTALLDTLANGQTPTLLVVPAGTLPALAAQTRGSLRIERIDFLSQPHYDRLLWMADLNFVRGEDSVIRAVWAGKPAVWHIYPQAESAHLAKLDAWLAIAGLGAGVEALIRGWNGAPDAAAPLADALADALAPVPFGHWTEQAEQFRLAQMAMPDLATRLDQFCREKRGLSGQANQGKSIITPERLE